MRVLMDGGDADAVRRRRIGVKQLAVDGDLAAIGRIEARHQLDQRRFAGAVLAEQRGDLAGAHVEIDVVERQHARKGFRDAARDQNLALAGSCQRQDGSRAALIAPLPPIGRASRPAAEAR